MRMLRRDHDAPAASATTLFTASGTGTSASRTERAPQHEPDDPGAERASVDDGWSFPAASAAQRTTETPLFSEARLREAEDRSVDVEEPPASAPYVAPVTWEDQSAAAELSMLTAELHAFADEPVEDDEVGGAEAPEPRSSSDEPPSDTVTSTGQRIRVHDERIDNRPGPIRFSPSEAVALAKDGPRALHRRTRR